MAYSILEISYAVVTSCLLLSAIAISNKKATTRYHVVIWSIFGVVFSLYSFSWLFTVYPLVWLPDGWLQFAGITLFYLSIVAVSVPCYAVIAFAFPEKRGHLQPHVFGALLMGAEVLRSLCISLLFFGKNSTLELHFSAGTTGNALSVTPFIEFAYFGGPFALSYILGVLLYSLSSYNTLRYYWPHLLLVIVVLVGVHYGVPVQEPTKGTRVAIITTDIATPKKDKDSMQRFFEETKGITLQQTLSLKKETTPVDVIVYPEDSNFFTLVGTSSKDFLSMFPDSLFVDGNTIITEKGLLNISAFYTKNKKVTTSAKQLLLPFNEYIPYVYQALFLLFMPKEELADYITHHTYTPMITKKSVSHNGNTISTIICSEILSHSVIRFIESEDPSMVIFQSRLNVFNKNPWFMMHLYSFTKVASATMRITVLSSTNGAPSLVVSPFGRILRMIPIGNTTEVIGF